MNRRLEGILSDRRLVGFIVAAMLVFLGAVLLAAFRLRQLTAGENLARLIASQMRERLQMEVSIELAEIDGVTRVDAVGLRIDPGGSALPLEARSFSLWFSPWALLRGALLPHTLELGDVSPDLSRPGDLARFGETLALIEARALELRPNIAVGPSRIALPGGALELTWLRLERPQHGARRLRAKGQLVRGAVALPFDARAILGGDPMVLSGTVVCDADWIEATVEGGAGGLTSGEPYLNAIASIQRLDLGALRTAVALGTGLELESGNASGDLKLVGPIAAPEIRGKLLLSRARLRSSRLGPFVVKAGRLDVSPAGVGLENLLVDTDCGPCVLTGRIKPPLAKPALELTLRSPGLDLAKLTAGHRLPAPVSGQAGAEIAIRGSPDSPRISARLAILAARTELPLPGGGILPVTLTAGRMTHRGSELQLSEVKALVAELPFDLSGTVRARGKSHVVALRGKADDVEVARLLRCLPPDLAERFKALSPKGRVDLSLELDGRPEKIAYKLSAAIRKLAVELPFAGGKAPVELDGGVLSVTRGTIFGSELRGRFAGGRIEGSFKAPLDAAGAAAEGKFGFDGLQLPAVVPELAARYALSGGLRGSLTLGGGTFEAARVEASASGLSLAIPVGESRLPIELAAGKLFLQGGTLRGELLEGHLGGGQFRGRVEIPRVLEGGAPKGEAALVQVRVVDVMPELAEGHALSGKLDGYVEFGEGDLSLTASMSGLESALPIRGRSVPLHFRGGEVRISPSGMTLADVDLQLTPGAGPGLTVDGRVTEGRFDLRIACRDLDVNPLVSAFAGREASWERPVSFDGTLRSEEDSPVLSGTLRLGTHPTAVTTAAKLLDGLEARVRWDGALLRCEPVVVGAIRGDLEVRPAPDETRVAANFSAADLGGVLRMFGAAPGIARGNLDGGFVGRVDPEGAVSGRGHTLLRGLVVDGANAAGLAGISNPSTTMRGAGGFLSLGLLPGPWSLAGQVASGQLHLNARYADFAFSKHEIGDVRWDFLIEGNRLEGPVRSSPDTARLNGKLQVSLAGPRAEGRLVARSSRDGVSMVINPFVLDTDHAPPAYLPDGLSNIDFSGAGDAFAVVGAAGGAILGGLLKGGTAVLGPAALVPMIFMGEKEYHPPYRGAPGQRPSAAEATVRHGYPAEAAKPDSAASSPATTGTSAPGASAPSGGR